MFLFAAIERASLSSSWRQGRHRRRIYDGNVCVSREIRVVEAEECRYAVNGHGCDEASVVGRLALHLIEFDESFPFQIDRRSVGKHGNIIPQIIYEFWSVATRPIVASNGLGLTVTQAKEEIAASARF
jgi:hypothetical protein